MLSKIVSWIIFLTMWMLVCSVWASEVFDLFGIEPGMTIAEAQVIAKKEGLVFSQVKEKPFIYQLVNEPGRTENRYFPDFFVYPFAAKENVSDPANLQIYRIEGDFSPPRRPAVDRSQQGVSVSQAIETLIRQFGSVREVYWHKSLGILLVFEPAGKFAGNFDSVAAVVQKIVTQDTDFPHMRFAITGNDCLELSQKIGNFARIGAGDLASMYTFWVQSGRKFSTQEKIQLNNSYGVRPFTVNEYLDAQYGKGTAASASSCKKVLTAQLVVLMKPPVSVQDVMETKVKKVIVINGDFGESFKAYAVFKSIVGVDENETGH